MTHPNRDQLIALVAIFAAGFIAGCATNPPPLTPNNPADLQVRGSSRRPRDLLAPDETTLAIKRQLAATQAYAESAEEVKHDMSNMPGMQQDDMQGMQHEGMKMEQHDQMKKGSEMAGHEGLQHAGAPQPEEKAMEAEMKKTSDEMKATSDAMKRKSDELKRKSDEMKTGAAIYTCPRHPQVSSDKPGNCPICGIKLVPKKEGTHEEH